jgi:hypothetical protein
MGDRANIIVKDEYDETNTKAVVLYTHWAGTELPDTLKAALRRGRERWPDGSYLTRIIFCEMVGHPDTLMDTTGYGISASLGDNEHPYLVVDVKRQVVVTVKPTPWSAEPQDTLESVLARAAKSKGVPFEQYIGR